MKCVSRISSNTLNMHVFANLQQQFRKICNHIEKSNLKGKPKCPTVQGKRILWSHLVDAYKFDQSFTTIHLHEKLTETHDAYKFDQFLFSTVFTCKVFKWNQFDFQFIKSRSKRPQK